ncbi:Uncharacterized protein HZ326_29934 [Fusarium oxysporum f. sp. albedinis]|nr:Uncharacterized protein HZ326_29934 [Fusarium oxysporum f. sp. albedinis]
MGPEVSTRNRFHTLVVGFTYMPLITAISTVVLAQDACRISGAINSATSQDSLRLAGNVSSSMYYNRSGEALSRYGFNLCINHEVNLIRTLCIAATTEQFSISRALLQNRVDVDMRHRRFLRAIEIAAKSGDSDIIELFWKRI